MTREKAFRDTHLTAEYHCGERREGRHVGCSSPHRPMIRSVCASHRPILSI